MSLVFLACILLSRYLAGADYAPYTIFLFAIFCWLTEVIPIAVTSAFIPLLCIFTGTLKADQAFAPFSSQIIFLLVGSFLLTRAMEKHGLDRRMAYFLLSSRFGSSSPMALVLTLTMLTWVVSMWMSNTAACAMMLPLCLGVLQSLKQALSDDLWRALSKRLLLMCAVTPSIGGMTTPVGSLPNVLALHFLHERGLELSFFEFAARALPVSSSMLLCSIVLLNLTCPVPGYSFKEVRGLFKEKHIAMGRITLAECFVVSCFLLAVSMWTAPGFIKLLGAPELSANMAKMFPIGAVAVFSALILMLLPITSRGSPAATVIDMNDLKGIDWGTIVLFGGGLCLGEMLEQTGTASQFAAMLLSDPTRSIFLTAALVAVVTIVLSEFCSNTASATLIIPLIAASAGFRDPSIVVSLVLTATISSSFGYSFPVSTPPNAMVYATGLVSSRDFIRNGVPLDLLGLTLVLLSFALIW